MGHHFDRGLLLYEQSRYDLAEKELRQELAEAPENAMAHALLGLCLNQQKQYAEATRSVSEAVGLAPDLPFTHYALASVLYQRDHLKKAEATLNQAIALDPLEVDYFSLLAAIRFDQRRWQAALEAAEQGLALDAEHAGCTNLRAMALVKLGRRQEAGATIDSALARDPDNAVTHANQGWTLLEQGDEVKAMHHFREALRLEPDLDWARVGILEALKARYKIYRLMLWYFLWMSKLGRKAQWGIVLGGWLGIQLLIRIAEANPVFDPWIWTIIWCYVLFAVLTWIAKPLSNLLLRLNRFGRLALAREEIIASNWVGGCLLAALGALGWAAFSGNIIAWLGALVFGLLVLPLAGTFRCPTGWPRTVMALYTLLVVILGLGGLGLFLASANQPRQTGEALVGMGKVSLGFFFLGIFFSGFLANGLMMARPRR